MPYQIRNLQQHELSQIIDWAEQENWLMGDQDDVLFYQSSPTDFLGGFLDNRLIASISCVNYGPVGFIGLYIVLPEFRNQGFGLPLFQAALNHLNNCQTIGLNAALTQVANYQKVGFVTCYAQQLLKGTVKPKNYSAITNQFSLAEIKSFFDQAFPCARENFMMQWLKFSTTLVYREGEKILGLGCIRPGRSNFHKIGPIIANKPEIAQQLIENLVHVAHAQTILIGVPHPNANALKLYQSMNFEPVITAERMYRNTIPFTHDLNHVYGVASFELG